MKTDIIITHLLRNGITIDPVDNCKLFVPQGTIIKVRNQYAICKLSQNSQHDCLRCIVRDPFNPGDGACATLMCTKTEREDETEVFFEPIDTDEETTKEGRV